MVLSRFGVGSADVLISESYEGWRERCSGLDIHEGRYDLLGCASCKRTSCTQTATSHVRLLFFFQISRQQGMICLAMVN